MSTKEKFPLYLSPEKKATLERRYTEDGSWSITGFIENAIDFYLDYLSANNSGLFLPSAVQSYLDGRLDQMENRMASLLFKQAVELDMGLSMLFKCVNVSEEELRRQRAEIIPDDRPATRKQERLITKLVKDLSLSKTEIWRTAVAGWMGGCSPGPAGSCGGLLKMRRSRWKNGTRPLNGWSCWLRWVIPMPKPSWASCTGTAGC